MLTSPNFVGRPLGTAGRIWLIAIALIISSLQVALPCVAYTCTSYLAYDVGDESMDDIMAWELPQSLIGRLSLRGFFRPVIVDENLVCLSATVHGDELLAVFRRQETKERPPQTSQQEWSDSLQIESYDVTRCDLLARHITTSAAPPGIRHVLSDGDRLWWLPEPPSRMRPFLHERLPTVLVSCPSNPALCQLVQFVDNQWRETQSFGLLPDCFDGDGQPIFHVVTGNTGAILVFKSRLNAFATPFNVGSRQQAEEYVHKNGRYLKQMDRDEFLEIGWRQIADRLASCPGAWQKNGELRSIQTVYQSDSSHWKAVFQFEGEHTKRSTLASQLFLPTLDRSEILARQRPTGGLEVALSREERAYVLAYGRGDGRLIVLKFSDGRLDLVAQQTKLWKCANALITAVAPGAVLLIIAAITIPMIALGICASFWPFVRPVESLKLGREQVVPASVVRRGAARCVDLLFSITFFIMAFVFHPDSVAWWNIVTVRNRELLRGIQTFLNGYGWNGALVVFGILQAMVSLIVSIPLVGWISLTGLVVGSAQVVWQARTGRTIGKWLFGIKVVRTTLRPCGIARSLLREILLGLDSLLLLSWTPGVISILATQQSKRIGDRMADTIVIRDAQRR